MIPETRSEIFLANIAGEQNELPAPQSRIEHYLNAIAQAGDIHGGSAGAVIYDKDASYPDGSVGAAMQEMDGDISENTSDISQLKSQINDADALATDISKLLYQKTNRVLSAYASGYVLTGDGYCALVAGYTLFKYTVTPGEILFITNTDMVGTDYATFQFQNGASVPSSGTKNIIGTPHFETEMAIVVPTNATYLILSAKNTLQNVRVDVLTSRQEPVNLFDKSTAVSGYVASNGTIYNPSGNVYKTSDYIDVSKLDYLVLSYSSFHGWYDSSKTFISPLDATNTLQEDKRFAIPDNAKYVRFSMETVYLDVAQAGQFISRKEYRTASEKYVKDLVILEDNVVKSGLAVVVATDGTGDYTSFTKAIYETVDTHKNVVVKEGTYNIVNEYVDLFGQDVVDSLADATSGIKNFQYGIRIHDRTVEFMPGAKLVCDWTGHTVDASHRFSALAVDMNAEIIGLELDCTATLYAIHDDFGQNVPFTNKYKNCVVIGNGLVGSNCIGGGCHKYSTHILENCYFDNNVTSDDPVLSADVRYHNPNTAGAEPRVYVSNCYFSNNLNLCYYGTQTTKMKAYVNNCYAPKGIIKRAETDSSTVDNIDLYAWNNQTS